MARFVDWIVGAVGLLGLALSGAWAVYMSPASAPNLQEKLQNQSSTALRQAGHTWATVRLDGQHAHLSGTAPSAASLEAALEALKPSLFFGPITGVTTDVQIAEGQSVSGRPQ